jgi:hypothetical protein
MMATRTNSPKRTRFDESTMVSSSVISPTAAAETSAATAAASLPIALSPFTTDMSKRIITLYRTLHEQKNVLEKIRKQAGPPRSARVKFNLTTLRRFDRDAAFTALQQEANDEVAKYQAAIKSIIERKVEFEIEKMKEELTNELVHSSRKLVSILLLALGVNDREGLVSRLTKNTFKDNVTIAELKINLDPALEVICQTDDIAPLNVEENNAAITIASYVLGIFVTPLKVFQNKQDENTLFLRIRSLAMTDTIEGTTSATAMAVDEEETASPESIRQEITKQVTAASKGLQDKMDTLLKTLKNHEGTSTTASLKKKKARKNETGKSNRTTPAGNPSTANQPPGTGQKVEGKQPGQDARSNASAVGNKKKRKNNTGKKSTGIKKA